MPEENLTKTNMSGHSLNSVYCKCITWIPLDGQAQVFSNFCSLANRFSISDLWWHTRTRGVSGRPWSPLWSSQSQYHVCLLATKEERERASKQQCHFYAELGKMHKASAELRSVIIIYCRSSMVKVDVHMKIICKWSPTWQKNPLHVQIGVPYI